MVRCVADGSGHKNQLCSPIVSVLVRSHWLRFSQGQTCYKRRPWRVQYCAKKKLKEKRARVYEREGEKKKCERKKKNQAQKKKREKRRNNRQRVALAYFGHSPDL